MLIERNLIVLHISFNEELACREHCYVHTIQGPRECSRVLMKLGEEREGVAVKRREMLTRQLCGVPSSTTLNMRGLWLLKMSLALVRRDS